MEQLDLRDYETHLERLRCCDPIVQAAFAHGTSKMESLKIAVVCLAGLKDRLVNDLEAIYWNRPAPPVRSADVGGERATEDQKDKIIRQAKEVCRWIGWMQMEKSPGFHEVEVLKKMIEDATGKELGEYT